MRKIRVSAVQTGSILFDTPATLDKFETLLTQAAQDKPDLVVFPEAFIGGYPKGHHFGAPVGSRSDEGRAWFARYFDSAITVPGPETDRIAKLAKTHKTDIVVGVIERGGATLYCSVLCFSREGELLGKRRKLMPTAAERLIWGFGDGSTLDAFNAPSGKISTVICWENFMPALRLSQYGQGVELYCAPTVDDRESWSALMRVIALEGRCFTISASQYLTRADCPKDYHPVQGEEPDTILINGGSVIVSPLGQVLAGPVFGKDAILTAQIDMDDITRGKFDFDVSGHYARPDVFELHVNRDARKPVI
ncbi:MAG: carbon-nitrogen hydrolase family protein [Litorimonas sp.]